MQVESCNLIVTFDVHKEIREYNEYINGLEIKMTDGSNVSKLKNIKEQIYITTMQHFLGNHALNVFLHEGNYYGVDVTNLMFLDNINPLEARYVGTNISVNIKPYVFLLENIVTYESFLELFENIFKSENRTCMNVDKMVEFTEEVMDLCGKNIVLFEDFYSDIHEDILGVCKILER